jgi:hypothetical protein
MMRIFQSPCFVLGFRARLSRLEFVASTCRAYVFCIYTVRRLHVHEKLRILNTDQSVRRSTLRNPANDPFGVDLESTLWIGINLGCSFPLLKAFSVEVIGFATILFLSTVSKGVRVDLAWSWFEAINRPLSGSLFFVWLGRPGKDECSGDIVTFCLKEYVYSEPSFPSS